VTQMLDAPKGRVDAFGVGKEPERPGEGATEAPEMAAPAN
jgi:hypothetical protein